MPPLLAIHHPSESPDNIEWLSADSINSYCTARRDALKKDEQALELVRDELMRSQKETIVQGLCKMTKDVKKLSLKEFNATFGCDVVELIREQMAEGNVSGNGNGSSSNNGGKKRSFRMQQQGAGAAVGTAGGLSLKTPAAHRFGGKPPMTLRTARRGEVIKSYSEKGSPVDQFDRGEVVVTAKKRRAGIKTNNGKTAMTTPYPISIGIGNGNGETIDLSDPSQRKNLDGEQKAQAMQQLMAIQEQMTQLMQDF